MPSMFDQIVSAAVKTFGTDQWNSSPELRLVVRQRAVNFAERLSELEKLATSTISSRRKKTYLILRSANAKFCSLLLGWPRWRGTISLAEAEEIAAGLDARKDCGEPVRLRWEVKHNGGFRPINSFGPRRRALQTLVLLILQRLWGLPTCDYAQRGRGREAVMQRLLLETPKKGGPRWFLTADIKDCFGSFNRDKMISLIPLPQKVIENCIYVMGKVKIIEKGTYKHTSEQVVLRGLPQGSLASSYIAAKLIEPVLAKLNGSIVMSYVDDIIVGCKTKKEAQTDQQTLEDLFKGHPAGPLFMKSNVAPLGKVIDFLSYRLRRRWLKYGGGVRLTPSSKAFDRLEDRYYNKLIAAPTEADFEKVRDNFVSDWMNGHRSWDRSAMGDEQVYIGLCHALAAALTIQMKKAGIGIFLLP